MSRLGFEPRLDRSLPFVAVHAALDTLERMGSCDVALVAIDSRRIADGRGTTEATVDQGDAGRGGSTRSLGRWPATGGRHQPSVALAVGSTVVMQWLE